MSEKHHPFSPSQLYRRVLCPGSYRMEEGLSDTSSPEAAEGTMLHREVAWRGTNDSLTDEQQEVVAKCREFLAKVGPNPDKDDSWFFEQALMLREENS